MSKYFRLRWDHRAGEVQIVLPSRTRLNFPRDSHSFLWAFCNALELLAQRNPAHLRMPIGEREFRQMYARWKGDGNRALKEELERMPQAKRERLTDEQIEEMRLAYLAAGNVVIKPLGRVPRGTSIKDLTKGKPISLEGLKIPRSA